MPIIGSLQILEFYCFTVDYIVTSTLDVTIAYARHDTEPVVHDRFGRGHGAAPQVDEAGCQSTALLFCDQFSSYCGCGPVRNDQ